MLKTILKRSMRKILLLGQMVILQYCLFSYIINNTGIYFQTTFFNYSTEEKSYISILNKNCTKYFFRVSQQN